MNDIKQVVKLLKDSTKLVIINSEGEMNGIEDQLEMIESIRTNDKEQTAILILPKPKLNVWED